MSRDRTSGAAIALAMLLAGSAVASPGDDEPASEETTSPLSAASVEVPHLRAYTLTKRRKAAERPAVMRADVAGEELLFVDVDGNGRYGDLGVDGWTLPGDAYRYVVPIERVIVVGLHSVKLRFPKDKDAVVWSAEEMTMPPPPNGAPGGRQASADAKAFPAAVRTWNDLRIRNGLLPARLDLELSRGCQLHAVYMTRHGMTHNEDETASSYTAEGAEAGRFSGLGPQPADREVLTAYRTLFHRIQLIHPETRTIGIGNVGGNSVLDGSRGRVFKGRGGGAFARPVIMPAPGTVGHPCNLAPEEPMPHTAGTRGRAGRARGGCPITLTFLTPAIRDVKAELRRGGERGKAVEILLSWPERPAAPSIKDNYKTIGIIARKALRSRTEYWVRVEWMYEGKPDSRAWTFKTGR